jgi:hypothetical protein
MKRKMLLILCGPAVLAGFLSACSFGGGDETTVQTRSTTTGQELLDLKAAYDKGVLTERQYEQQREKLLRGG